MTQRQTSRAVDDAAAQWAARVDRGELTPQDERALEEWLSSDPRHLGAFAKARAISVHLERARALGAQFEPERFIGAETAVSMGRRAVLLGGIAAAAASIGGIAVGWKVWQANPSLPQAQLRSTAVGRAALSTARNFSTRLGETRVIPLEDGSVVTLNTASAVFITYTSSRRAVVLVAGEALFDVEKDRNRPFVVLAHDTEIRAVGTSFTVQSLPQQPVRVLVREGVVEVDHPRLAGVPPVRVAANSRIVAASGEPIIPKPVAPQEIDRELVWRVGRLAFEGETLAEAAEKFARYSETRILIEDASLAGERITGLFVSNDPVGFARAAAISLNARAEIGEGVVRLTR